ncbi:DUF3379 family protein [Oleiagrimonas sp. C23AA]|uniref:DUF3379 family protein n=1 Tax=Oleiagrimonas sp. C23AA TaxID=2719047 RepID=UPI001423DD9E|nr:DUF3379 family protein [Oleiagrimonas sp. C23AA]NII11341.1 DUF3379 domain-containing protein [Oleiagrimonas sp. C23AA]
MDCLEFRRRLGAEPRSQAADMLAHRLECAACQAAWQRAQQFEDRLEGALKIDVPEGLTERALLAQSTLQRQRWRRRQPWLAVAASLILAMGVGGYAWQQHDAHSLPALSVAHMPEEIASLDLIQPLTPHAVKMGFAGRGVALRGPVPSGTTYVHDCMVGPYKAVHLVTRHDGEPVVVLYFPHRQVSHVRNFQRQGWVGREVPMPHGGLVMLTDRGSSRPFSAVASAWTQAIEGHVEARTASLDDGESAAPKAP